MHGHEVVTLVVVVGLVTVLVRDRVSPAAAVVGAAVTLLLMGVLDPETAFAGFASPTVVTVAALYVVAGAVRRSGVLEGLVGRLLGRGSGRRLVLARLLAPVAAASAFLNNTPIVAALAPVVHQWSTRRSTPVSRLLMPLSYATIFGGVATTIGTSTNLVVSGLLVERGLAPFGLFEVTAIGAPLAVLGVAALIVLSPRLLPDHPGPAEQVLRTPERYAHDLVVEPGGVLDGRSVTAAGLRDLDGVYLATLRRGGRTRPAAATDELEGGDVLTFVGGLGRIDLVASRPGLKEQSDVDVARDVSEEHLVEVVVAPGSPLVGTTLKQAGFRERYDAAVLALHRGGRPAPDKLGSISLRSGDALLLFGDAGFAERWGDRDDFGLIAPLRAARCTIDRRRALLSAAALVGLVLSVASGVAPVLEASLAAALGLLLTRTVSVAEARAAIDLDVLLIVGGSFALGAAIEGSGLAARAADLVAGGAGTGRLAAVVLVVGATMALTEPLSNAAAAALMLPIGLDVAGSLDGDPRVFAVGVALAASASFLTPIGYQTNTMVYGLGGYRFADYARLGAPLTLLSLCLICVGVLVGAW